jgi:hypothetical protein
MIRHMSSPLRVWLFLISAAVGVLAGFVAWFVWSIRDRITVGLVLAMIFGGLISLLVVGAIASRYPRS